MRPSFLFFIAAVVFIGPPHARAQEMSEEDEAQVNQSVNDYLNYNAVNTFAQVTSALADTSVSHCNQVAPAPPPPKHEGDDHKVQVNFLAGNILGGKPGSQQDKTYELSFGTKVMGDLGFELSNLNEGDPLNNHRDGFAAQATYEFKLTPKLKAQLGLGPYLTMNTTTVNGGEYDVKRVGMLASASVLYQVLPTLYGELRYNHVNVSGEPSSNIVMVGVQGRFNGLAEDGSNGGPQHYEVSVLGGYSHTNRQGSPTTIGEQLELRDDTGRNIAYSVSVIRDGPHGGGGGVQVWYVRPLNDKWTAAAGAGSEVDFGENATNNRPELAGLISLEISRKVTKRGSIVARFTRKVTRTNEDHDFFFGGYKEQF
jgi:hypothetical protein